MQRCEDIAEDPVGSSSPSPLDHSHDSLAAAAFIAKTNLESEEERKTDSVFHGGFGLINYQQIVKPAFTAYRFMSDLGDTVLARTQGGILTRNSANQHISGIFYSYPAEMKVSLPKTATVDEADRIVATGSPRTLNVTLTGLKPGATFLLETLDKTHGNPVLTWEQMGRPEPPTREQTSLLKRSAWATQQEYLRVDGKGTLYVKRYVDAWSVVLLKQMD